jgi:hypothetical protein
LLFALDARDNPEKDMLFVKLPQTAVIWKAVTAEIQTMTDEFYVASLNGSNSPFLILTTLFTFLLLQICAPYLVPLVVIVQYTT